MTKLEEDPNSIPGSSALANELCDHLERSQPGDTTLLCHFAREFFSRLPRPVAQRRTLEELSALVVAAFRFLERSRPDQVNVEVVNPEDEGWSAPFTVVRVVLGDRPFIVDSIREYLAVENLTVHRFIHPVLLVERDEEGRVVEVGEGSAEALVHCEISRIPETERRGEIRSELSARLADVVAATDDFDRMTAALEETLASVQEDERRFPERAAEMHEVGDFLRWLADGNFVFLGFRVYDVTHSDEGAAVKVERGSGLGILRKEDESAWAGGVSLDRVPRELRRLVIGGPMLLISKTNAESTVHRRARMDYIGVKKLDGTGEVVGERRFLGLFTSKAYQEPADTIPILRDKLDAILRDSGAQPGSHDYKEIITIFNTMPKEELFRTPVQELEPEVQTVLSLLFSDRVHVTLRSDPLGRGVSLMVILPRGRFSGDVRQRIQEVLTRRLGGEVLNYHLAMGADDQARLHFYLSSPSSVVEEVPTAELQEEIGQLIRTWDDRLGDALVQEVGEEEATRLAAAYADGFNEEYRAATPVETAVLDVLELERLRAHRRVVGITLSEPKGRAREEGPEGVTLLKLYLVGERLVLSDFMPILDNAGLRVVEVTPFSVTATELPEVMIYAFAVQGPDGSAIPLEDADLLAEALLAIREGDANDDPFNALVLAAGLRWREVELLRAYVRYAFQIGAVPTRTNTARALTRYNEVARLLVELFAARFAIDDSLSMEERQLRVDGLRTKILRGLEAVSGLSDDRALRRVLGLIEGTTRTNYYRHGGADPAFRSGGVPYLSLKFRCADVEELRKNRLLFEVFVFSSRMEGIHLRAAPVSRGGIRWSDRPDDFRTEIMGLVQTQIVKNAVIVPSGSKGGFITRRHPAERDAMMAEAADQYRTLMRGLLDITDNLKDGTLVPPEGVVRYDGDDPYLVVAADKGTAHLSDVANSIAAEYGFWLGDAFASGGSHGYDHKAEGITARGGWECVKRHFREMGKDIQAEPFTAVGIGDMSGDVFGNGMILSHQTRLIAAFDHRDIFIDPDPDLERSFVERKRLFELPRSSWQDYDRAALSAGAMIVPRASKEVELTPQAMAALGLDESAGKLDGEALVRAVLRAPVELLWNGGIGTYVKDSEETDAEVGDSANDAVRIDAEELRCKVVGEGGNLGFTQRARIAYALAGGRIDTDALDNSAGVDMSDHEVNLKILLNPMVTSGAMAFEDRNTLLAAMTDEVSELVLHNNVSQSLAISLDEARSREALGDFAALITAFERESSLERTAEGIPRTEEIAARAEGGMGLTRPTLCVLLAYAKLNAGARLLASSLPDDPATREYLVHYFPPQAVAAAGAERLDGHRLRREIITTYLINDLVDLMGSSFLHRVARETGREIDQVVRAWFIASRISGAEALREDLERLELKGEHATDTIYRWLFGLARVLDRTTRWVLNNVAPTASSTAVIEEHLHGLGRLRGEFNRIVAGEDRAIFEERMTELSSLGLEPELAARIITLRFLPELLDILRIANESGTDAVQTAQSYYIVSERLGVAWLQQAVRSVAREDVWEKRLSQQLLADVGRAHRSVSRSLLQCEPGREIAECLTEYEDAHAREAALYREVLDELRAAESPPLAGFAVAVQALAELAEA
jgi:glutamate dehydrogenase